MNKNLEVMDKEWHIPDSDVPLMQGDILICREPTTSNIESLRLVITADCDISKGKFGAHLASLQIISLKEYFRTIWSERKLRREIERETINLKAVLDKWNKVRDPDATELSLDAVARWATSSSATEICQALSVPTASEQKVLNTIGIFQNALSGATPALIPDNLDRLVAFRSIISSKTLPVCMQEALKQAQQESLPEDVFLLPDLPQIDTVPALVLLRIILPINLSDVYFSAVDATNKTDFLRIGRLHPTFKHAISQAFGSLYSRIGMPDAYETRHKAVMHSIPTFV